MPRIRFTVTPKLPRDLQHLGYEAGTEVDLSDDQAGRWLRRGVAVVVAAPAAPATAAVAPLATPPAADSGAAEMIPGDWQNLHHMARMALARRITTDPVPNLAAADAVIAAEVERRAA